MPSMFRAAAIQLVTLLTPVLGLAQVADLKIRVFGTSTQEGTVEISIFNSAETFMREPFVQMAGRQVGNGTYEAHFTAVPTGNYAVVVVHDENGNGKFDNGLFGIGGEAYGFSNGVRPMVGWPEFEDAAFEAEEDAVIEIELR